MGNVSTEQRAAKAVEQFERQGKTVHSVTFNGKKFEITFQTEANSDEFSFIDFKAK